VLSAGGIEVPLTDAHHVRFLAHGFCETVWVVALHMLSPLSGHGSMAIIALGNKYAC
jgi:hypothetical protein